MFCLHAGSDPLQWPVKGNFHYICPCGEDKGEESFWFSYHMPGKYGFVIQQHDNRDCRCSLLLIRMFVLTLLQFQEVDVEALGIHGLA